MSWGDRCQCESSHCKHAPAPCPEPKANGYSATRVKVDGQTMNLCALCFEVYEAAAKENGWSFNWEDKL